MSRQQFASEVHDTEPSVPNWLTTYSDLMCLLVTFFVMLFPMLTISAPSYRNVAGSLALSMGQDTPIRESVVNWRKARKEGQLPTTPVRNPIVSLQEDLPVVLEEKGPLPAFDAGLFFMPGSSVLSPAALPVLEKVANRFKMSGFKIQVQGYPDDEDRNVPFRGSLERRDLAGARALAVADYLVKQGLADSQVAVAACDGFITDLALPQQGDIRRKKQVDIVMLHE